MATQHILVPREAPKLLTVVIPIFNEEETIPLLRPALERFAAGIGVPVEFCIVNDGSSDRSIFLLADWAAQDPRVKLIGLSRNFGHQVAVTAGLDHASGDAVVIMDADLQDPPEVIPAMIEKYREGYDVVYGRRMERKGETRFKLITAWAFYRLMRKLVHPELPTDVGDFRLVSSRFLREFSRVRESHRFLRGLIAWCGFPQTFVGYTRAPRAAGVTKYPLRKMLQFAWNAAVSFSPLPMKTFFYAGIAVALIGFVSGLYAVARWVYYTFWHPEGLVFSPGWTTLMVLLCLIGGTILMGLGVLGEYIARIFEEAKARPHYFVSFTRNIEPVSCATSRRQS